MKPLRHIQDFLDLVERNACSAACERAARSGTYTTPRRVTLPWGHQGWTFKIVSQRGSEWSVTIEVREAERTYRVHSRKVK